MPRCHALSRALRVLEGIAPLKLAAPWDNVGLLVDASKPHRSGPYRVLLTNDITPLVLAEAVALGIHLLVSYHPTPFSALKRFDAEESHAANVVLSAAREGFAVYSPHTALDAVSKNGLNDWLIDGVIKRAWGSSAADASTKSPVKPSKDATWAALGAGDGRLVVGLPPVPLSEVVAAVKDALSLRCVQLALPASHLAATRAGLEATLSAASDLLVSSICVCAGSGSTVLSGCSADVWLTGEMGHHDVLAATTAGRAVILTNHTNCERGYLPCLRDAFISGWKEADVDALTPAPAIDVLISAVDADPLVSI